ARSKSASVSPPQTGSLWPCAQYPHAAFGATPELRISAQSFSHALPLSVMAEWVWEAKGPAGEVRKGQMEADDEEAVQNRLRQQKLVPTKVKKKGRALSDFSLGSGVSQKDLVTFTRLLATMIDAGLPIVQCLDILGNQTDNKTFSGVIADVKSQVE